MNTFLGVVTHGYVVNIELYKAQETRKSRVRRSFSPAKGVGAADTRSAGAYRLCYKRKIRMRRLVSFTAPALPFLQCHSSHAIQHDSNTTERNMDGW